MSWPPFKKTHHDELDGRADEAVLDGAGEQEGGGILQQPAAGVGKTKFAA